MLKLAKVTVASFAVVVGLMAGGANGEQAPKMENHSGHSMHTGMTSGGDTSKESAVPGEAGQDAFGTIQEIITILQNDPHTDWSRVNIRGLREHLIDMNDLTLKSTARLREIAGGLVIDISGDGRVREAVARMIPAHAPMLVAETGWQAVGEKTKTGARLTVTSNDPTDVDRIRGLGFYGLMATGGHHQSHHLGMARGEMVHRQ